MSDSIAQQLGGTSDNAVRELRSENQRLRQRLAETERRGAALEAARTITARLLVNGGPERRSSS